MKFVASKKFTPANRTEDSGKVTLVVIHTAECSESSHAAENVAAWGAGASAPQASWHYCIVPSMRVLLADMRWVPASQLREGDAIVTTEEEAPGMSGRTLRQGTILRVKRRVARCVRITLSDGRELTCSRDHRWLAKHPRGGFAWRWVAAEDLGDGDRLCAPLRPWEDRTDRDAGYMEGIFDGEGSWTQDNSLCFAQKTGAVLDRAVAVLDAGGIPYRQSRARDTGVVVVALSGIQATLQALGQFRPRRLAQEPRWKGRALRSRTHANDIAIEHIEDVGEQEVVSLETSDHTFFAEGVVSHNCVDNDSIVQSVHEKDIAWHAGPVNGYAIGVEHAGFARQTEADWSDDYSTAVLERSAELVAGICRRHGIPVVRVTAADLKAGRRAGICGHVDVTMGLTGGKGHSDPGAGFPWERYLELVRKHGDEHLPPKSEPALVRPGEVDAFDAAGYVPLDIGGVRWLVSPIYVAPIGIGQAADLAKRLGCELPTPALVDAIWRAADLRVPPHLMIRSHDGTPATMDSPETHAKQARALDTFRAGHALGRDFKLLGGAFKDVVSVNGKPGLYGWHADERAGPALKAIGVRTSHCVTPGEGRVVQPPFTGHGLGWRDYSQGLRLVRRA